MKRLSPGRRFQTLYHRELEQNRKKSSLRAPLLWGAALASVAVGVVLVFIPGPAILFFALAAALVATQSAWAARALDWSEVKIRAAIHAARRWWNHRSKFEKIAAVAALAMVVAGLGAVALTLAIRS